MFDLPIDYQLMTVTILVGGPETFMITLLGFKFININMPYKNCFIVSVATLPFLYILRYYDILFWFHILTLIIVVVLVMYLLTKIKIIKLIPGFIMGVLILTALEHLIVTIYILGFDISLPNIRDSVFLYMTYSAIMITTMLSIYYLFNKRGYYVIDLSEHKEY